MRTFIAIAYLIYGIIIILYTKFSGYPISVLYNLETIVFLHLLFIIAIGLISIARLLFLGYKKGQFVKYLKKVTLWTFLPIGSLFVLIKGILIYNQNEKYTYEWNYTIENTDGYAHDYFEEDGKIRGLSLYALGRSKKLNFSNILISNVEYLAVHPYLSQIDEHTASMKKPLVIGQWSQQDSAFIHEMERAKSMGLEIMLKPHLWLMSGWRSDIEFESTKQWETWFEDYRANILHYAHLAELSGTKLLCIGTELESSLENQTDAWIQLIAEIRDIYSGRLTYAGNWNTDLFFKIPKFWDALDYIGVQAYFPLTAIKNPTLEEIKAGWDQHLMDLQKIYNQHNKPILFTEIGYRADAAATIQPWKWNTIFSALVKKKSTKTQQLAYEAFFEKVWTQPWFAGAFVWQWNYSIDFSIYDKPAQNIIADWYGRIN